MLGNNCGTQTTWANTEDKITWVTFCDDLMGNKCLVVGSLAQQIKTLQKERVESWSQVNSNQTFVTGRAETTKRSK